MTESAGAIALVGSGEYLEVMDETDNFLLSTLGGPDMARVVVIPTASGLEPGMPKRWSEMGVNHFQRLGAAVRPAMIIGPEDTARLEILDTLRWANFFYFSGGNPNYLVETYRGSPAWDIIRRAHLAGAVLAGCSAGAMAFGGYTLSIGSMMSGQLPKWVEALGLLPGIVTFPHFDRMSRFLTAEKLLALLKSSPATNSLKATIAGVDEDTALVRLRPASETDGNTPRWQVMGHKSVTLFDGEGQATIYHPGALVGLDER